MTSLGTVTSLGVGSGFELQQMLDDFREIDEAPINSMREEIASIEERLDVFDTLKSKLFDMKSHALSLSLSSNFLERTVSASDPEIAEATVLPGTAETSTPIEVTRLASRSSWQTAGVESADKSVYIPTAVNSEATVANADAAGFVENDGTLLLTYGAEGSRHSIGTTLTAGMSLNAVVEAINTDSENNDGQGGTYVTASTYQDSDGGYHLRIDSTAAGSTEANRLTVTDAPEELGLEAPEVAFNISLGAGDPVAFAVAADTTFNELVDQINSADDNPGVTAKVINDGTDTNPYRLVITADNFGEDNRISVSGIQMTEVQGADNASLNAEISVDGILYQRQSNDNIDDIVQGVTLNLKNEGEITVSVGADYGKIRENIIGLVDTYNELLDEIDAGTAWDAEAEEWGLLATTYSVRGLPSELNSLISTIQDTSGSVSSLYDIGLEINRDGTISINEETLDKALASKPDDVADLFLSDDDTGRRGLADLLNDRLRVITGSNGIIGLETSYAENEISRMETDIENASARLDKRYDLLARQFVELDMYISQMQAESDYLTTVFDSISNPKKD